MTDLGEIESYLSMCIVHDRSLRHIEIDQSGYIKDVLEHFVLHFSLGLLRTAYLPVMTTAQIASLVMDCYLKASYHMYDNDTFLGSL